MSVSYVEASPDGGFEYPYYLYVPDDYAGERPLLVEPTNSAQPSDDFDVQRDRAERRVERGVARRVADELAVPLLHPVFPRPASEPVDWTHSIHQLCARTMRIDSGPLERVDRQLQAMIDDARARLSDPGQTPPAEILLNGFSASGTFANRFAVLHPDRVLSVSAGGVNGMVTLPMARTETDRHLELVEELSLEFPVGVADIDRYTGEAFDLEAFRDVTQFIYMGAEDDNDTLRWPDVWTETDIRASAILTYGPDIHAHRFPFCASVYAEYAVPAVFRTYPETGHDPTPAIDDIVRFHEASLAGADIAEISDRLGGKAIS
jgi:dienelactone hydrolase